MPIQGWQIAHGDAPTATLPCAATVALAPPDDSVDTNKILITGFGTIASFGPPPGSKLVGVTDGNYEFATIGVTKQVTFLPDVGQTITLTNSGTLVLLGGASRIISNKSIGVYCCDQVGNWSEQSFADTTTPYGIPAHGPTPTGVFFATITPTLLGINVTAVDTTNDLVTIAGHGLTTGQNVVLTGTVATGLTTGTPYYVRSLSANTIAFYLSLANARADTGRVNITSTTTAWSLRRFIYSSVFSLGFDAVAPVASQPGFASMNFEYNLATPLATTVGFFRSTAFNLVTTAGATFSVEWSMAGPPTFITPALIQHQNTTVNASFYAQSNSLFNGSWAQQASNAFSIMAEVFG